MHHGPWQSGSLAGGSGESHHGPWQSGSMQGGSGESHHGPWQSGSMSQPGPAAACNACHALCDASVGASGSTMGPGGSGPDGVPGASHHAPGQSGSAMMPPGSGSGGAHHPPGESGSCKRIGGMQDAKTQECVLALSKDACEQVAGGGDCYWKPWQSDSGSGVAQQPWQSGSATHGSGSQMPPGQGGSGSMSSVQQCHMQCKATVCAGVRRSMPGGWPPRPL